MVTSPLTAKITGLVPTSVSFAPASMKSDDAVKSMALPVSVPGRGNTVAGLQPFAVSVAGVVSLSSRRSTQSITMPPSAAGISAGSKFDGS
jgi:hypothetical protein